MTVGFYDFKISKEYKFILKGELNLMKHKIYTGLEVSPIIAAAKDKNFDKALQSNVSVIFLLGAKILSIKEQIEAAHKAGKYLFVHIDLAEGIGKDRFGIEFLARSGVDGILSTKTSLIKAAKDFGLITVQRFFIYDSQGVDNIAEILPSTGPDFVEMMPGVVGKVIKRFSRCGTPVIAGGLIETKQEVTGALSNGAFAVSTGKEELWHL